MKLRIIYIVLLCLFVASVGGATSSVPGGLRRHGFRHNSKRPSQVSGEVLVKFAPQHRFESNRAHLQSHYGARSARKVDESGLTRVKIRDGQTVEDAIRELSQDSSVEYVQPNNIYRIQAVPNDPDYSFQWALKNTGKTMDGTAPNSNFNDFFATNNPPPGGTVLQDMDLQTAWDTNTDCSSVIVAVIDTGVNYNHDDLASNMWTDTSFTKHGYDFLDDDDDPMDPLVNTDGHGTHVAGIIGAVGNNAIGISGVCWKAKIMAIRGGDETNGFTTDSIVKSINFAVAHGAKIINMSLGGDSLSASDQTAEQAAITNAVAHSVLVVAAAGNGDDAGVGVNNETTPFFPCNFTGVLCVAALDEAYAITSFSNYGTTHVQVAAPGLNILSVANATIATTALDPLTGWTLPAAAWANHAVTAVNSLTFPAAYDGAINYTASQDARAYKNFNLSAYSDAEIVFNVKVNSEAGGDILYTGVSKTGGEPFASNGNLFESSYSGAVADDQQVVPISGCISSTCTFGFDFKSNANVTVGHGIQVHDLFFLAATASTTKYRFLSGTSMAAPYVAGLAALVWSYNPRYSLDDVITAIKSGGVTQAALLAKVATGKSVSASGSLKYINPPTNVTAAIH